MATTVQRERILSFEEARQIVVQHANEIVRSRTPALESAPLLASLGRILAEPVIADRDLPSFARATRDGFAVVASDVSSAAESRPVSLRVVGEIPAGATAELPALRAGEAAEIMTGAPVPPGADAVVMIEYTRRKGDAVAINRAAHAGENIVARGAEAKSGQPLLARGTRITEAAIAVAASAGKAALEVFAKPRVAVLATGNEVV